MALLNYIAKPVSPSAEEVVAIIIFSATLFLFQNASISILSGVLTCGILTYINRKFKITREIKEEEKKKVENII
jgi:hypothetical protein